MKRTIIQLSFGLGVLALLPVAKTICGTTITDRRFDGDPYAHAGIGKPSEYSAFCEVVRSQGLDSLLSTDQTFTVWAPTNEAMAGYVEDADTKDQF